MKEFKTALIIDDDIDLCLLLKAVLTNAVEDVLYVHNLQASLDFIRQNQPEVIFLDNNLPDGQGINYIREIKAISTGSLLIVISALAGAKKEALENGADIFIEKPLTEINVLSALKLVS